MARLLLPPIFDFGRSQGTRPQIRLFHPRRFWSWSWASEPTLRSSRVRSVVLKAPCLQRSGPLVRLYEAGAHGAYQDNVARRRYIRPLAIHRSHSFEADGYQEEGLTKTSQVQAANCRTGARAGGIRGASPLLGVERHGKSLPSERTIAREAHATWSSSPGRLWEAALRERTPSLVGKNNHA